jgi:predicted CopG family antitoxin
VIGVKQIKVSDDVYEQLKKIAEKNGDISLNDAIKMLLSIYLGGSSERAIDRILSKEFVADREIGVLASAKRGSCRSASLCHWVKYVYSDGSSCQQGTSACFECANPHLRENLQKEEGDGD